MSPADDGKQKAVENLPEAEKQRAIEAAQAVRDILTDQSVKGVAPNPNDATGSPAPAKNEFEKALEEAQRQQPREGQDHGKDI